MKLSEAMRLGAMLRPQGYGFYQTLGGSCAYGAAMEACGIPAGVQNGISDEPLRTLFPISRRVATQCPACTAAEWAACGDDRTVDGIVPHLNDDHRWTREQIAAWVETIEAADDSTKTTTDDAFPRGHQHDDTGTAAGSRVK